MSTIVCLKEAGRLVLGTDSRFMNNDFSGVESDSVPKIHRVAEGTFLATTGWNVCADLHAEKASELAESLGTSDIRTIAKELELASRPLILETASVIAGNQSLNPHYAKTLDGKAPLQGFMLAGRGSGILGCIYFEYWIKGDQVTLKAHEYFGADRVIRATGIDPLVAQRLGEDWATWTGEPVTVVRRYLAEGRRTNPHIGGPDQVVEINGSTARWISRLPVPETVGPQMAHAVISASIEMTAPKLTISSGVVTVNIDSTNFVKLTNATFGSISQMNGATVRVESSSSSSVFSQIQLGGFTTRDSGGNTSDLISDGLYFNTTKVVGARGAAVSNPTGGATVDTECRAQLSTLLSRLRAHGLIAP